MNDDESVVYRDKSWWEHYPLHKLWCNDLCPLVPRFEYRAGDEWNANNWSFHWLLIHVWTMEHFSFGLDAGLSFEELYIGAVLPWFRITLGIRHAYSDLGWKLSRKLRRKATIKNENGEYN
jgi:hypothetical protein